MTGQELVGRIKANNASAKAALALAPACMKEQLCAEHPYRGMAFECSLANSEAIAEYLGNGLTAEIQACVREGMAECHDRILKPEIAQSVADAMRALIPALNDVARMDKGPDRTLPTITWGKLVISGLKARDVFRLVQFGMLLVVMVCCFYFMLAKPRIDHEKIMHATIPAIQKAIDEVLP